MSLKDLNVMYRDGSTNIETTVYRDDAGVERCAYTFPYPAGVDKTVTEYLAENPGAVYMSFDEALDKISAAEQSKYIKPWMEITEDQWTDALEVLPPEKWQTVNGVELFRMSERPTGDITAHYARIGGRYFTANRRTSDKYEKLAQEVRHGAEEK